MGMIRVLITGSRSWENAELIDQDLARLEGRYGYARLIVITGGAAGADKVGGKVARDRRIHVADVGALWDKNGRAAGPLRNHAMLGLQPHLVLAYHYEASLEWAKSGTYNMVKQAREVGIKCVVRLVPVGVGCPSSQYVKDKQAAKARKAGGKKRKRVSEDG